MKYCTHCGKPIDETAKFCPYCGRVVQKETSTQFTQTQSKSDEPRDSSSLIKSIPIIEQITNKNKISLYVIIYSALLLIGSFVIYQSVKNINSSASSINSLEDALNLFNGLKSIPYFYYFILVAGLVVLILALYRFLRNKKCYLYLAYSIGIVINTLMLLYVRIFIRLVHILDALISAFTNSGLFAGLTSALSYESELKSMANEIKANQTSYKACLIIMLVVVIVLLIMSVLSTLRKYKKIKIPSFFKAED
jgi:hypothetical protein